MPKQYQVTAVAVFLLGIIAIPVCGLAQIGISVDPGAVQFPSAAVGAGSPAEGVTVSSLSNQPQSIGVALNGGNASDFAFTSGCPPAPQQLASYSLCKITVTFTPSAAGVRTSSLTVTPQSGHSVSILLAGEGQAVGKSLAFNFPALTFPAVGVGAIIVSYHQPTGELMLSNTGNAPVAIQSILIVGRDPEDFVLKTSGSPCPSTLAVRATCAVDVAFEPTALGSRTAAVAISSDAVGGTLFAALSGVGAPPFTQLSVDPVIDFPFGPVGSAQEGSINLENTGSNPVTINNVDIVGVNASDFSILGSPCGTLDSLQACQPALTFTPSAPGLRIATVVVSDTAPGSPHLIPLQGAGYPQLPSRVEWVSAARVESSNFGAVVLGGVAVDSSIEVYNGGEAGADLLFQVQGPDAADFRLTDNCTDGPLDPGKVCSGEVVFAPSAAGTRVASIAATASDSGQTIYWPLIGSGVPPNVPLAPLPDVAAVFAAQVVGTSSAPMPFGLSNQTQSPVTITGFVISGGSANDFQISQNGCVAGTVIPPNGKCSSEVTFTPPALGVRATTAVVSYQGGASALQFPLSGTSIPAQSTVVLGPQSLFGERAAQVGQSIAQSAKLTNGGYTSVTISGTSVVGPAAGDYSVTGGTCPTPPQVLPPGEDCQINLTFVPSVFGLRSSVLQVSDSATGSPQNLPLLGAGWNGVPLIQSAQSPLNFGAQALGSSHQQSAGIDIATGLLGAAVASISSVSLKGPNASDFSIVNGCPSLISSRTGCAISVTFTPSVTGLRTAEIEVTSNASPNPLLIPLSGVGMTSVPQRSVSILKPMLIFPFYQGLGYATTNTIDIVPMGNLPVSLTSVNISGLAASDFSITSTNCPLSPTPLSKTCDIEVSFSPTAVGLRVASLNVADNGSQSPQSIPIIGLGAAAYKEIVVLPKVITFNPTNIGSSSFGATNLDLYNAGTVPLTVQCPSISGANASDFTTNCNAPFSIPIGGEYGLNFTFRPSADGPRTATILVTSDAANGPRTIALSGTGQGAAIKEIAVAPKAITFNPATVGSSTFTSLYLDIADTGTVPLTVQSLSIAGVNASDFTMFAGCNAPFVLSTEIDCSVSLTFTPSAAGLRTATILVTSDAANGPQTIVLSGTGQ